MSQRPISPSSTGNGSWLKGTMEVISGIAVPRPSTPQALPSSAGSGGKIMNSLSAPNSPARRLWFPSLNHTSSEDSDRTFNKIPRPSTVPNTPGRVAGSSSSSVGSTTRSLSAPNSPTPHCPSPNINRLPSKDSLDRSIHNELGNGKSTAQIISDLKQSNASLSAQQAALEQQFMNSLAEVTKSFEKERKVLLERVNNMKNLLAQKDEALCIAQEKSSYQRHVISDLKNQLYRAETKEVGYDCDKLEHTPLNSQEMEEELARLQAEFNTPESQETEKGQHHSHGSFRKPPIPPTSLSNVEAGEDCELQTLRKRLFVTDSSLKSTDAESQAASDLIKNQDIANLKRELEDRDNVIAELKEKVDQYAEKAAVLTATLAEEREIAASQDEYRRDEAEDLRILLDAQEEDITKLRKELDDVRSELELREEELQETNMRLKRALESSISEIKCLKQELSDSQSKLSDSQNQLEKMFKFQNDLEEVEMTESESDCSSEPVSMYTSELKENKRNGTVACVEKVLPECEAKQYHELEGREVTINSMSQAKVEMRRKVEEEEKEESSSFIQAHNDFKKLRHHWEQKCGTRGNGEPIPNRNEINRLRGPDAAAVQGVNKANRNTQESQETEEQLEGERITKTRCPPSEQDTEALSKALEALKDAEMEISQLRNTLQSWESGEQTIQLKQQLREAQVALVALDEENQVFRRHGERPSEIEGNENSEVLEESRKKTAAQDNEPLPLEAQLRRIEELEAEKTTLEKKVRILESEAKSLNQSPSVPVTMQKEMQHNIDTLSQQVESLTASLQSLTKEKNALQDKLKDRDTTINALLKSSVALEKKITDLESSLQESTIKSEEITVNDDELQQLRKSVASLKEKESRTNKEIVLLKKRLKVARYDAARWKEALRIDSSLESDYRLQVATLQEELQGQIESVKEQDRIIESLVNQNLSQETQARELMAQNNILLKEAALLGKDGAKHESNSFLSEICKLQEEMVLFFGQLFEDDDELKNLKKSLRVHSLDSQ